MEVTAFVFPGQGSQRVGMGLHLLAERPDLIDRYFGPADELLGLPLSRLCWEGPAETLRNTAVTQPAVFLTSLAVLETLRGYGLQPDVVAGHSLGEFAALVCAGVLDWTDAIRLVRMRGLLMAEASQRMTGAMAAVMNVDVAKAERLCAVAAADTGQVVEVANDNGPSQVVVSGHAAAVARVSELVEGVPRGRAVPLDVGGPFHCSLMGPVEAEFAEALADVGFRDPRLPVVSSATGEVIRDAASAVRCLRRQVSGRVRWTDAVHRMTALGAGRFIEVGPGRVLAGLCRQIAPGATVHSTHDDRALAKAVAEPVTVELIA